MKRNKRIWRYLVIGTTAPGAPVTVNVYSKGHDMDHLRSTGGLGL